MIKSDIRILILYLVLSIYLIFLNFIGEVFFSSLVTNVINPLFWLILLIILYNLKINSKYKVFNKVSKLQVIFIIVIIYLILYFLSGLILGYGKNPIFTNFLMIIKNLWIFIVPIIGQEYAREKMLKGIVLTKLLLIIYYLIFIIYDINLYNFINRSITANLLIKNTFLIIFPVIASNFLFTYLSYKTGMIGILIYKLTLEIANILLPILPNINWLISSFLKIILPFIVYIFISKIEQKKKNRRKRTAKIQKCSSRIILVFIAFVFILFILGYLRYKPIVIMSNSMSPVIKRGDIVINRKVNLDNAKYLKEGEIIEYRLEDMIVVHRIHHIEKHNDNEFLIVTKGDNNQTVDVDKVDKNQILGVVRFRIPKIGYPLVWLNEYLK